MKMSVKLALCLCIPAIAALGFIPAAGGELNEGTDGEIRLLWQFDTGG